MKKNVQRELSFYAMYLRRLLKDIDSPKKDDETFIKERVEAAEKEWEERRRDGLTVDQAQECAMEVLTCDINNEVIDNVSSDKTTVSSEETIANTEETPINSEETPINAEKLGVISEKTKESNYLL